MIIAFTTIKSSLVPLIEGLCAQIQELRFEIIGGLCSHLFLFFFGRKNMLKKKKKKKKLRFRMNIDGNLNAVDSEGVTSIALILK